MEAIRRIIWFVALVFLQVALFDKVHLFGYATPLLYIYFIIKLPVSLNRNAVVLLSALLGLCIDIFDHTLGLNMLACVVAGFMRFYLLKLFAPRDVFEDFAPSLKTFGHAAFFRYVSGMILLHQLIVFSTEAFSLFDAAGLFLRILGSFVLTLALVYALENINWGGAKNERR
ncbi:rod shape-determining protein MreD [Bacteroidia bacterium]|nr:rod shape-determining protein MreD [Bacteroidia bacterium]